MCGLHVQVSAGVCPAVLYHPDMIYILTLDGLGPHGMGHDPARLVALATLLDVQGRGIETGIHFLDLLRRPVTGRASLPALAVVSHFLGTLLLPSGFLDRD